jgi:pimeloyl-ACP methyl ester carboxylesterase
VDIPETRYIRSDDAAIAYSVTGDGPIDLVLMPGYVSQLEHLWDGERPARFLRRLASFSRLVLIDRRGTGLSDRVSPDAPPSLETQMDDLLRVLDAVGSERAALFGIGIGAMLCAMFAATFPQRTASCVLYGTAACGTRRPDYPWQRSEQEEWEPYLKHLQEAWGTQEYADEILRWIGPSLADDDAERTWWARLMRLSASPSSALALERLYMQTDARWVLGSISVPVLVAHRTADPVQPIEGARYIAEHIPEAILAELPGVDWFPWGDDQDALLDAVEEFLTGAKRSPDVDRVLATVLFTDIVGSTEKAAELGDGRWRELRASYHERVRRLLEVHRGKEVDTAGDGFFATFDGPARAVRCGQAIAGAVRSLGIDIRAGCHTGEVELVGDEVAGVAVHIGARVAALAGPGEVLASSTVKDLTAGSGLVFEDAGEHELKGVPDRWHLYRVLA